MDLSQVQAHQNPMVGREREMASLLAGLEHRRRSAAGSLFLISGEPGVGKTRLAEQLAAAAHARRFAVLSGNCSDQDEEAVPYLPFVEILETASIAPQPACPRYWETRDRSWRACCQGSDG